MKNRINATFEQLELKQKKALITFITAGDPFIIDTVELMHTMANNGVDLIELGVPFSDPMADGPIIQRSSDRAIKSGISLIKILDLVKQFRLHNQNTPVVLMGYANTFNSLANKLGINNLAQHMQSVGVDGLLIVDIPPEHDENRATWNENNIHSIYIVSPTTSIERINFINHHASGYVYYVALKGITGAGHLDLDLLYKNFKHAAKHIKLPLTIGFGIDTPQKAQTIMKYSHIVIGSKIISLIEEHAGQKKQNEAITNFIQQINFKI